MHDTGRALARALRRIPPEPDVARFVAAAEAEGLVDVAFSTIESPLGPLLAAVTSRGLLALSYGGEGAGSFLEDIARSSPRVLEAPSLLDRIKRELDEYFAGRRDRFEHPIDWSLTRGFTRKVLRATTRIPYGRVRTYSAIAASAGSPRGSRAAGNALGSNPIPIVVPCHRVVRTGGRLGGYTGGLDRKRFLLELEGTRLP